MEQDIRKLDRILSSKEIASVVSDIDEFLETQTSWQSLRYGTEARIYDFEKSSDCVNRICEELLRTIPEEDGTYEMTSCLAKKN